MRLLYSNIYKMVNLEGISKTIDDLNSQEILNIKATAKRYNYFHFTLQNHFNGKNISCNEVCFKFIIFFTTAQKSMLIEHVNKFSVCGLHLIFQMFKNFVMEIINYFIEKQ